MNLKKIIYPLLVIALAGCFGQDEQIKAEKKPQPTKQKAKINNSKNNISNLDVTTGAKRNIADRQNLIASNDSSSNEQAIVEILKKESTDKLAVNDEFSSNSNVANDNSSLENTLSNSFKDKKVISSPQAVSEDLLDLNLDWIVYFDFDKSDITQETLDVLLKHVDFLIANPDVSVRLLGHTDERGSREYNLALGEDRAIAVEKIFNFYDISNIQTVSYGEENPMVNASNEAAWEKNRRVEIIYLK